VLTLRRRLDREQQSSTVFELVVTAENEGFVDMTSSAAVTVHVEDLNDNSPIVRFPTTSDHHLVQLSRQTPVGTLVTRIDAFDPDAG